MRSAFRLPGHGAWFTGCAEKRARVLAGLPPTPPRRRLKQIALRVGAWIFRRGHSRGP